MINHELSLFSEIIFNPNDTGFIGIFKEKDYFIDEIHGSICRVTEYALDRFKKKKEFWKYILNKIDIIESMSDITGVWCKEVCFN